MKKLRKKILPKKRRGFIYQGTVFASNAEREFAMDMDKNFIYWMYEPEKFPWEPPKKRYTPDFKVQRYDGSYFYVEYKGYLRPTDRTKMRAIKKQYPFMDLRFVFMNAKKKLSKGSKNTYADWAEKHGYLWAEGEIPEGWLEEKEAA